MPKKNQNTTGKNPLREEMENEIRIQAERIKQNSGKGEKEAATIRTYVEPFIKKVLGYDTSEEDEVNFEYPADYFGSNRKEVDCVLCDSGDPIIAIECKRSKNELSIENVKQLNIYFSNLSRVGLKYGILTNGIDYLFFSDIEGHKGMDIEPFMEFSFREHDKINCDCLEKFHKEGFHAKNTYDYVTKLKRKKMIKDVLKEELENPSNPAFVNFIFNKAKKACQINKDKEAPFKTLVRAAFSEFSQAATVKAQEDAEVTVPKAKTEKKAAIAENKVVIEKNEQETSVKESKNKFSPEEIEIFNFVKASLEPEIDSGKLEHRPCAGYSSILYENNKNNPICRLYLNRSNKRIEIGKPREKVFISEVYGVLPHLPRLKNIALEYKSAKA